MRLLVTTSFAACHPEPCRRDHDHGRSADLTYGQSLARDMGRDLRSRRPPLSLIWTACARSLAVCAARDDMQSSAQANWGAQPTSDALEPFVVFARRFAQGD
jgi:hypothetical protein